MEKVSHRGVPSSLSMNWRIICALFWPFGSGLVALVIEVVPFLVLATACTTQKGKYKIATLISLQLGVLFYALR